MHEIQNDRHRAYFWWAQKRKFMGRDALRLEDFRCRFNFAQMPCTYTTKQKVN